ncbi:phosphohydrolase [Cephaloticoccus primus]|uniref:5'-deoxynucleotidase n=1 Tax=Cephaloticoccus primus TaxID=1548207 RepID=A0A139SMX0_9BACT|nr:HD domain-containing protein [Cephaloticoccus primus]KXU35956.1 phosphohydrolase [Cephaloticoccus primus]
MSTDLSPSARLARQMQFIIEADKLKEITRQTLLSQSRRAENSAEHSWHFALMVMTLAEHAAGEYGQTLDVLRVIKMALIHDLVEIDAGDTFAYDTAARAAQHEREARAAERIFGLLPEDQARDYRALWDEFEAQKTPEARFAAACDRLNPILLNCLTDGAAWQKHGITQERIFERNAATITAGAPALWAYAEQIIRDTFQRGLGAAEPV